MKLSMGVDKVEMNKNMEPYFPENVTARREMRRVK